ncbi:MAG: hypothetical protein IBX69_12605 [Anaerolineales bacterium]|nr:hypothetical protein [Anaerolineales bacterium]
MKSDKASPLDNPFCPASLKTPLPNLTAHLWSEFPNAGDDLPSPIQRARDSMLMIGLLYLLVVLVLGGVLSGQFAAFSL